VVAELQDANQHGTARDRWGQVAWIITLVIAVIAVFGPLLAGLRRNQDAPVAAGFRSSAWQIGGLVAGAFPAAGFAANAWPWWRSALPLLAWVGLSVGVAGGIGLGAWALTKALPGRTMGSPLAGPGVVGLVSAGIMLADPFTGGLFTREAPLGHPTLLGARFFGYANTSFSVLAVGAVLAAALAAGPWWSRGWRWRAAAPIGVIGLGVAAVVGYPALGADLGGALTSAAGFLVMAALAADVRFSWRVAVGALVAGVAASAAVAFWDYARGPERWTHLGAFVDTVAHGGLGEVLWRKGLMWARLSVGPALALVIAGLVVAWWWRRGAFRVKPWRSMPLRRPVIAGLIAVLAVGSLVNDSGLVVAVIGLAVAGPLGVSALAPLQVPAPPQRR
jgi:hypothetical protein